MLLNLELAKNGPDFKSTMVGTKVGNIDPPLYIWEIFFDFFFSQTYLNAITSNRTTQETLQSDPLPITPGRFAVMASSINII